MKQGKMVKPLGSKSKGKLVKKSKGKPTKGKWFIVDEENDEIDLAIRLDQLASSMAVASNIGALPDINVITVIITVIIIIIIIIPIIIFYSFILYLVRLTVKTSPLW